MIVEGNVVDIRNRNIFKGRITTEEGRITKIERIEHSPDVFILPGFIDAHIHIESSMVTPSAFARAAACHGTIATVSDPHEIANVCGIEGVNYMIEDSHNTGIQFFFGAPSCVPATGFETSGAVIDAEDVRSLLERKEIWYLSEMMNYPGVINEDNEVIKKIQFAKLSNKPIDGHAPGLMGEQAAIYASRGITTDHECTTLVEALSKLNCGMKILIREGSAAKNFDALHPLIENHANHLMFCSDDKHPDDLLIGHINLLVNKALSLGYDLYDLLQIACLNPIDHYKLPIGSLQIGDQADFMVVEDLKSFKVRTVFAKGHPIFENNEYKLPLKPSQPIINNFNIKAIDKNSLILSASSSDNIPVIVAIDGSLITEKLIVDLPLVNGCIIGNPEEDILKIVVVNRYINSPISIGFVKNFNLVDCAIASTVAHDSHNIICVGTDDELIYRAINHLIQAKGGLVALDYTSSHVLPLPIAGLMSDKSVEEVGKSYSEISDFTKKHGCKLNSPFMTLSFMALLVIPKIKISDLGVFDGENFEFYSKVIV
jgi:adenine deaminase